MSSTKWRILVDNVQGGLGHSNVAIAEMEYRLTVAGADQATGGTATASGNIGSGYEADKAFDDDAGTMWNSGTPIGSWLQYEFTSSLDFVEYTIQARASFLNDTPTDWRIQEWNGTSWDTRETVTGEPTWSGGEIRTYSIAAPAASKTRVAQLPVEAVSNATPAARIAQMPVEAVSNAMPMARIAQMPVEVVSSNSAASSTSQPTMFIIIT